MSLPADYEQRAKMNDMAPPADIMAAMNLPGTVVLDVRTEAEIAEAKLDVSNGAFHWAKTGCSREACPALESDPTQFVPTTDTTVVVYCKSGARANRAKKVLEGKGYTRVLNGGGLADMVAYRNLV